MPGPWPYIPGVPAAGHVTSGGFWHGGRADNCPRCSPLVGFNASPAVPATPTRGANLMNDDNTTERVITVGYTQPNRPAGYAPTFDGYRPGAAQHVLTVTVQLSPELTEQQIAELVFIATNAPELEAGSPEIRIRDAIVDTGYKGTEAHWSLSVGDTVRVGGSPRLACGPVLWTPVEEDSRAQEAAGKQPES